MAKELIINLDDALYTNLVESVGEKNVNRFIESAVRSKFENGSSKEVYDIKTSVSSKIHRPRLGNPSQVKDLRAELIDEAKNPRPFGLAKGEFIVPDDFDAPLPEEILASFER